MPRSLDGGPEKTLCTDVVIAAHATRENHYAILVHNSEISQVSNYKISITLLFFFTRNVFGHEFPQSAAKIQINYELTTMNNKESYGICCRIQNQG